MKAKLKWQWQKSSPQNGRSRRLLAPLTGSVRAASRGAPTNHQPQKMSNTATHGMTDEGLRRRRKPLDYLPEPKLRDADIARRMFLVGSCLLPVIWLVCVARFWRALAAAPSGAEAEELRIWVRRSAVGLACAVAIFTAWTIIFQTKYEAWGLEFLLVT